VGRKPQPPSKVGRSLRGQVTASVALVLILSIAILVASNSKEKVKESSSPIKAVDRSPATFTIYTYNSSARPIGQGSGFFINSSGLALTNFHVVKDAYSAEVRLSDGSTRQVEALDNFDADSDLAILLVANLAHEHFSSIPLSSSSHVKVGDAITTISSPEGLENTVTVGVVSALRNVDGTNYVQLSAPVSNGSSGSPVLANDGTAVGITTFQYSKGQNLNFAIGAEHAVPLLNKHYRFRLSDVSRYFSAIAADNEHDSSFNAGLRAMKSAQYELAIKKFSRALELRPKDDHAYFNRALCHEALGNETDAALDYILYLQITKDSTQERAAVESWLRDRNLIEP
jgi:S1-C subfamily serine protease